MKEDICQCLIGHRPCIYMNNITCTFLFLKLGKEVKIGRYDYYVLLHPGPSNGLFDCLVSYKPMRAGRTVVCMTQ